MLFLGGRTETCEKHTENKRHIFHSIIGVAKA